jgi:phage head maturation protease
VADFLSIAGYAAPFDRAILIDGVIETIAPGAFQLGFACQFKIGSHESASIAWNGDGTLRLWEDAHGLAFLAHLPRDAYEPATVRYVRAERPGASVNFVAWRAEEGGDKGRRRIVSARINHIALLNRPAYGAWTGAWMADDPEALRHPASRPLARRWASGFAGSGRNTAAPRRSRPSVPPSLIAMMTRPDWARVAAPAGASSNRFDHPGVAAHG